MTKYTISILAKSWNIDNHFPGIKKTFFMIRIGPGVLQHSKTGSMPWEEERREYYTMKAIKLPSGNYRVSAYLGRDQDGREIRRSFVGPDKHKVLAQAAEFVDTHRYQQGNCSLRAAVRQYITSHDSLSPATIRGYETMERELNNQYSSFMDRKCMLISVDDVQAVIDAISKKHSAKTVRNYSGFISAVLRSNRIAMPIVALPNKDTSEPDVPDAFMIQRILSAAGPGSELWVCIALASMGPLRAGEIAALGRSDMSDPLEYIDRDACTIHVAHDMVYGPDRVWHIKEPKTPTSDRILTMPREIIDAIVSRGYVTNWTSVGIYSRFERLLRNNGIPHYRFHDLRHTCASMLHAKGYPDKYIQARTGHASDEVLRRVYTHVLTNERQKIESEIVNDFEALLS